MAGVVAAGLLLWNCQDKPALFEPQAPTDLAQLEPVVQEQFRGVAAAARNTAGRVQLCRWYHAYHELSLAEACYRAVLGERVSDQERQLLGHVLREAGRYSEAAALFAEVRRAQPHNRAAGLWEAAMSVEAGDLEQATRTLNEVLARYPGDLRAVLDLAQIDLGSGRAQAAIDRLEATGPAQEPELLHALAEARRIVGGEREKGPRVGAPRQRIPRHDPLLGVVNDLRVGAKAWSEEAGRLLEAGRVDEALELYRQALVSQPTWPFLRLRTGEALERAGQLEAARSQYLAAVDLDPAAVAGHLKLARLAARRRSWDEAESAYAAVLALDEVNLDALMGLAAVAIAQGQPTRALDPLAAALAARPGSVEVRRLRLAALLLANRSGQDELDSDLEVFPEDAEVRRLGALLALQSRQPKRALELVVDAHGCAAVTQTVVALHVGMGRLDLATARLAADLAAATSARDREALRRLDHDVRAGRPIVPAPPLPLCSGGS